MGDGFFRIFHGLFGRFVAEVVGIEMGVHADAADERSLSFFETYVSEDFCGGDMFGGIVGGCCGAVGEGAGYAGGVDAAGFGEGGEG